MACEENKPPGLERVSSLAHNIAFSKLCSAVSYGARANIYKPINISAMELSSAQCLLLALFSSLVTGDVMSCLLLVNVCQQVQQLRSKYLRVWLTEDFIFPTRDVEKAMALLIKLVASGVIELPSHVMGIMSSLAIKYGITGVHFTSSSQEGCGDLAIEMENAVSNDNAGDIIKLVAMGGDINGLTQFGDSLLHYAARTGNCAAISVLGYLKAEMEIVNSSIATPLEVAVRNNNVQSVKALLMAGAKINKQLLRGDTYLHIAAVGGHNGVLLALLEGGLQVNIKNHFGETPLFQAVRAGNVRGVEILLEWKADDRLLPQASRSLVEIAVESQNVAMFKVFMKSETLPPFQSKDGDSILHFIANSGNAEMLKILKDRRLSPEIKNVNGVTPLHVASDISIVKILLGMDSVIDAKDNEGRTPLMLAIKNLKPEIVTFLLYSGANLNVKDSQNFTPLHYAAKGGHVDIVTTLLEAGARLEEKDVKGMTPAFIAAVSNKPNILELLVEHGADLTLKDCGDKGMIHHAALCGYSEIVSFLLGAGVVVDMKTQGNCTALHYAAEKGHAPVVSVLLNRGADVGAMTNILTTIKNTDNNYTSGAPNHSSTVFGTSTISSQSQFGPARFTGGYVFGQPSTPAPIVDRWTPLIAAAKVGSLDVVKLLLDKGAAVNDRDSVNKWTALGWALNKKHTSVADYLLSQGGIQ
nr:uncharacterized protein LOC106692892 [Halyomorpha halys]